VPLFIWKRSYETGVPEIDLDHRQLVGVINELYEAMKLGQGHDLASQTIDRMLGYIGDHFATEEGFMRAYAYPGIAEHEEAHRELTAKVRELDARRRSGTTLPVAEMLTILSDWLKNHILVEDKKVGAFLKRGTA
jgi:hemerythrin-like metal-binding protein